MCLWVKALALSLLQLRLVPSCGLHLDPAHARHSNPPLKKRAGKRIKQLGREGQERERATPAARSKVKRVCAPATLSEDLPALEIKAQAMLGYTLPRKVCLSFFKIEGTSLGLFRGRAVKMREPMFQIVLKASNLSACPSGRNSG